MSDRGSSGLGLDIARSAAEASGGALELLDIDADGRAHAIMLRLGRDLSTGAPAPWTTVFRVLLARLDLGLTAG
jgi:hypothetical protein